MAPRRRHRDPILAGSAETPTTHFPDPHRVVDRLIRLMTVTDTIEAEFGADHGDWVAWTPFAHSDMDDLQNLVRRAARNYSGLTFREADGEMRAQILLESEASIEVRARLIEHLGEVADRLEFHLSDGADAF